MFAVLLNLFFALLIVSFLLLVLIMINNCNLLLGMSACGIAAYMYTFIRLWVLHRDIVDIFLISEFLNKLSYCLVKVKSKYRVFRSALTRQFQTSEEENVPVVRSSLLSSIPKCAVFHHCGDFASLEAEIDSIVFEISGKYIHSWFDKISDKEEFVSELNIIIKDTLVAVCCSVLKIDRNQFCYHILQIYLHFFHHFIEAKPDETHEKINWENFKMKHWATKNKVTEWCYLQNLISSLLDSFGPVEYHNSLHSKSSFLLHAMIVEILTENVLYPFINVISDSSHLNAWLLKSVTNNTHEECEETVRNVETISLTLNNFPLELFPYSTSEQNDSFSGPKILLSADDSSSKSFDKTIEQISDLSCPSNTLNIPFFNSGNKMLLGINDVSPQDSESDNDNLLFEGTVLSLAAAGLKSRSNVNLLETEYTKRSETGDMSSVFYDAIPIKRSKSADFIRQMSQMDGLMPLNTRNNSIKLHGRDNKTFVVFKYDANSVDVEEAEEATEQVEVELPPLFTDVIITDTFQQVEIGPLPYTLYCIQYSGIFHDIRKSTNPPELVKQVVCIKRRFREFVALQSRLEDNISLRPYLKGIKGPSKWLATPFSNLDKRNISERKLFLESYLQELCNQDGIARSSELQEFLAYGGDASIAFVKKATDISVPRIDKILFRGMKGAFDLFRTALPSSPDIPSIGEPSFTKLQFDDNYEFRFHDHALEYNSRESEMQEHIGNYFQYFDENSSSESVYDDSRHLEGKLKRPSLMRQMCDLKAEDSCKCEGVIDHTSENFLVMENSFGDVTIDLLFESLQKNDFLVENNIRFPGSFVSSSKKIFSSSVDKFVKKKLDEISVEKFVYLLHLLHKSLWDGRSTQGNSDPNPQVLTDIRNNIKELIEAYSTSSYIMQILKGNMNKIIDDLLSSIQDQQLNRCLLFHIFDVIIESLCSSEK